MTTTHTLQTDGAEITYDVHPPTTGSASAPPLMMIGQPMDASGFAAQLEHFTDRTVITYDPRGLGRSTRTDGRVDHDPVTQAADVHAVMRAVGSEPVDLFASSGGAVTALALVAAHPQAVRTLVAHEPPLIGLLPDADAADRATRHVRKVYESSGWGAGMTAFLQLTMWQGEFTDAYFDQPDADPAAFGLPTEDDGTREDPLLSDRGQAIMDHRPDRAAILAAATRVIIAVGEESAGSLTARTAEATARLLDQSPVVFPSHHSGFMGGEFGQAGQPEAFARRLRELLDA